MPLLVIARIAASGLWAMNRTAAQSSIPMSVSMIHRSLAAAGWASARRPARRAPSTSEPRATREVLGDVRVMKSTPENYLAETSAAPPAPRARDSLRLE